MDWWLAPLILGFVLGILTFGFIWGSIMVCRFAGPKAKRMMGTLGIFWSIIFFIAAMEGTVFEQLRGGGGTRLVGLEARFCGLEYLVFGIIWLLVTSVTLIRSRQKGNS